MSKSSAIAQLLPLVREYGRLEKKRTQDGVTPSEFYRWSELRTHLEGKFPQGSRPAGSERRANLRLPTRMVVEFAGAGDLQAALIRNISRGGLFISTPLTPEIGTKLELLITVANGERIELPVCVVCSGIPGPDGELGIGCKFVGLNDRQQSIVDEMFATAIDGQ